MAGTLISTFYNGDSTNNSLTAIQQTLIRLFRSHDSMAFGNYASGNTDMLNVLSGSAVVVNMGYYYFASPETIVVLNTDGTTTAMADATYGDYYIVAVINPGKTCTVYARKTTTVTPADNPVYGGIYITSTQQRVLGGFTKASGGCVNKWRYKEQDVYGQYYRQYADGVVCKPKINTSSSAIADGTAANHTTDTETVCTVTPDALETITVTLSAYAYVVSAYNAGAGTPQATAIIIIQDSAGAMVGYFPVTFSFSGESYTVAVQGCIPNKTYTVKVKYGTTRESVSNGLGTGSGYNTYGVHTSVVSVAVKDRIGVL